MTGDPRKIIVGISGASGSIYPKRLLGMLAEARERGLVSDVGVVLSRTAHQVWAHELGGDVRELGFPVFEGRNYDAPFASGSAGWGAMVVAPASMSSIARIAHGISDDLLTRAADVILKERRKLILLARETPYSGTHLENMLAVTREGAIVMPATPSFYGKPKTLEEAVDTVLARVLDHLGVEHAVARRWGEDLSTKAGAS